MEPPATRYARSGQLAIAYQVHGAAGPDLLLSPGAFSNVETAWDIPEAARLFERLGRFARVIRYDRRDTGISDPVTDDLTLEAHADDALAVMDAAASERPILVGSLDGARSLALLAATRPERVGGLIALSPTARGTAAESPDFAAAAARVLAETTEWPPAGTQEVLAPRWLADPARARRHRRYARTCVTPRQGARLARISLTSDVTQALGLVQAPTLVVHPRDATVPAEAVRGFADRIPGAVFREIPGDAAMVFAQNDLFADLIEEFVTGAKPAGPTSRILATVLFTDLVDSTRRAAHAGDRAWLDLLERHFADTRSAVESHGGQLIKTTGDGALALFTGPAQGVRCAARVTDDARDLGLDLRTGLHTGEVERTSDDVAGLAVHLAARIMSLAGPGETLVSRTVRDLVIGSELTFSDRGEHELKGIPDRWALYAVA